MSDTLIHGSRQGSTHTSPQPSPPLSRKNSVSKLDNQTVEEITTVDLQVVDAVPPFWKRALGKAGYYNKESKKFQVIVAITVLAIAAIIAIGLAVHFVGADKMLHWFQGDFTSWFKNNLVTWITNHADALKISACAVGGVALGLLASHYGPAIKDRIKAAFGSGAQQVEIVNER